MRTLTLDRRMRNEDLFDSLELESEYDSEKRINITSNVLKKIIQAYIDISKSDEIYESMNDSIKFYNRCLASIQNLSYDSKTVEDFSLIMPYLYNDDVDRIAIGYFLSGLMNNCKDKDFLLKVGDSGIHEIGYKFAGRNLEIFGDVFSSLGSHMRYGNITLHGNAEGSGAGEYMKRGNIVIHGNSDGQEGARAKGGIITINGDVTDGLTGFYNEGAKIVVNGFCRGGIGECMTRGEIYLNGDYESLSDKIIGGDIYHKGKLIIKNGKPMTGARIKWE